jgi:DNA (cytosine-5)-methyltransferase 1
MKQKLALLKSALKKSAPMLMVDSCRAVEGALSPEEKHKFFLLRNIDTIADVFEALYRSPNHGNKSTPIDELIYIHLSKKTNERGYLGVFDRLSSAFPDWAGLADADPAHVKRLIESAGLGNQRTAELLANIKRIATEFGSVTLDPLRDWSEREIYEFLTSLKGIGPKSALCIMMYSMGKKVFPVDTHVHVVCQRMGFISAGLNHDKAQEELAGLFPRKLRYGLHVNMVAHGRKICRLQGRPLCELCNLSRFCLYYRNNQRERSKGIPMVDVFCGTGGASLGFKNAGFAVRLAVDNDRKATDTYYLNNEELSFNQVITYDLRSLDTEFLKKQMRGKITLVFGGPPCQGWSNIGKNRKNGKTGTDFLEDQKNTLYKEFVRQLDIFEPRYFVMENVPGLVSAHDGKYARMIRQEFRKHKYESTTIELNASDYGMAQNRKRIFFIGKRIHRKGGTAGAKKELRNIVGKIEGKAGKSTLSFRDVTEGLPHLKAGEGANVIRIDNLTGVDGSKPKLIFNHFARKHNDRDLRIYELLCEGKDYGDFSRQTTDKALLPYSTESFQTKFRKIKGDHCCYAIISHLSKDANSYVHPDDNRGITVREAARVQSFPDDFIFLPKGFSQFINLGNAVPPKLAEVIGKSIIEVAELEEDEQNVQGI